MIDTDPPRHTRLRALVNRGFTPRAVAAYENLLRELTRAILDDALPQGEFDFIEHIAAPLPIQVLCRDPGRAPGGQPASDRLGRPDDRLDRPRRCRTSPTRIPSPTATACSPSGARPRSSSGSTATASPRPGAREPRDDLVTKLVEAEIDGERLTVARVRRHVPAARRRRERDHPPGDRPRHAGA